MKICNFICFLLFCIISFNAFAETLTISTDKDVVVAGDVVKLSISYDGSSPETPDLSQIQNDFEIVSRSLSSSKSFYNGTVNNLIKWTYGIIPLKTGNIKFSPFKIGNTISNSIELEVKEVEDIAYVADSKTNSNSPFFQTTLDFDVKSPYVQQQVTFLLTIYDSIGLGISSISIDNEAKKNWFITSLLDKPIVKKDIVDGKYVNTIQYAYAAFPQKSGNIPAPRFFIDGFYIKNNDLTFPSMSADFEFFGLNFAGAFNQKVPVKMQTKEIFIDVTPIPSTYTGKHWLPVKDLSMTSKINNNKIVRSGEAIYREINIKALGLHESLFPQLTFKQVKNAKQYPEKPILSTKVVKGDIETTATINNVYIPTKEGKLTLPSLVLKWFNVEKEIEEQAILPEEIIDVYPSLNEITNSNISEKNTENTKKDEKFIVDIQNSNLPDIKSDKPIKTYNYIYFVVLGFVLLSFIFFIIKKHSSKKIYAKNVIKAIKQHDYKKAKDSILLWARVKFNNTDIQNINTISKLINDDSFSEQLLLLNKIIYSKITVFFDNTKFIEVFKKIDKIKVSKDSHKEILPNLYD